MATSSRRKKTKAVDRAESAEASSGGFPKLKWERLESSRPTNLQRAVLAIAFALLLAWWVVLGWLVLDSLS